jgi:hypothetical protein
VTGLTDEEVQAQLAGIRYRQTPAGKIEIESKEDAKKGWEQSPDWAEALVLAFARVVPRTQTSGFFICRCHKCCVPAAGPRHGVLLFSGLGGFASCFSSGLNPGRFTPPRGPARGGWVPYGGAGEPHRPFR